MASVKKRARKRAAQKLKIARVGARLFSTRGYLETSMDGIAAVARLSKGGIYHYFTNKVEILYPILNNYMDHVLRDLELELEEIEESLEKIRYVIVRHIDLYTQHIHEAKTLLHEAHNLPRKLFRDIAEKERKYLQVVSGIISNIVCPNVSDEAVTALSFTLFGMCNWLILV